MNPSSCQCSRITKHRAMTNGAGWVIPSLILLLMPKCPLCLAAALSVLLGIGLSEGASTVVHTTLLAACGLTITIFVVRQIALLLRYRN